MTSIKLPRTVVNQLLRQAQLTPELEICGLISAKDDSIYKVYPVNNIATDKQHMFDMDPGKQIQAMKTMRNNNETLFAIYHSHPDTPAEPSITDIEQSSYPEALHLIISLSIKGVLEIKGFYIQQQSIEAVELLI
ncbi:MAG: M67 family metallopeptidase [Gammaproteobacteria bacterium]|nr:M67 family metallopeptidase [Gammaproteobacteria bacterium]